MKFLLNWTQGASKVAGRLVWQSANKAENSIFTGITLSGQAISPVCGCIAEVTMHMSGDDSMSKVEAMNVDKKRIMIGSDNKPIFTRKGNVLIRKCGCNPLSYFGDAMEAYSEGRTLDEMRNEVFRSGVPVSFTRIVRRKNHMPLQGENCLRLLNEALCDAVGGSSEQELSSRSNMRWPRPGSHHFYMDDDEEGYDNGYSEGSARVDYSKIRNSERRVRK